MSRSDYKNIYEGYLDNTGYNNRYSFRERYGGCGSEPTPYTILSEPSVAGLYEGYTTATTPTPKEQQAQEYIKTIYNNTKNYVDTFRKIATEYYIYGGIERFKALDTTVRDSGKYAKYVRYYDITKKNWVAYNKDDTHPSSCNLLNTVRTDYFRKGFKSEICCNENKTYYNYCYFNDDSTDKSIANSNISLDAFTFRVDVLKNDITKNYPDIDQTKLTFPSVYFTDQQFTTPAPKTTIPPPTTGSVNVRDYCDPNTTPSVKHLKYNTQQQCNKDGGTWNINKNNLGKCDAYCTIYK
jgi:hypothetical protein